MVSHFFGFWQKIIFSELCGLDLPSRKGHRIRHYENTHGVTADQAKQIASGPGTLENWRNLNGITDTPGQCGYCLKVIEGYGIHRHRKSCKGNHEVINCSSSSSHSPSSTLENITHNSAPISDSLTQSRIAIELRAEIKKLTKQNEQLKDSKANKLLAKSKSRVTKLESKVKLLKAENKKLSDKYVKVLETLLAKHTAT